ncbi:hypothetical protein N7520_009481 [Penicillium odoratum]|uniref:uncharacterized protein n=1 Tax=Penicillium odoratum TaxID=1167516 RepID=UPI002548D6B2|nr:uncharacterized protein N7520_009481 [Penicillium odoratum]KAJ5752564.1 hypothetical protein N7520_009481 [Penicillium odoratum]
MKSPSLLSLPFDLICVIVTNIGDRDYINLSRTHPKLYADLCYEQLARKFVELTHKGHLQEERADRRDRERWLIFDIHEALATAKPYSIDIIAYGSDFLYNQGFICYLVNHEIRLLELPFSYILWFSYSSVPSQVS